jgi:hypothetical protein
MELFYYPVFFLEHLVLYRSLRLGVIHRAVNLPAAIASPLRPPQETRSPTPAQADTIILIASLPIYVKTIAFPIGHRRLIACCSKNKCDRTSMRRLGLAKFGNFCHNEVGTYVN